jgi:hypothetical protein
VVVLTALGERKLFNDRSRARLPRFSLFDWSIGWLIYMKKLGFQADDCFDMMDRFRTSADSFGQGSCKGLEELLGEFVHGAVLVPMKSELRYLVAI